MRLDEWFVWKQLLPSKSKAIQFIREIGVNINGKSVRKPGHRIKVTDQLDIDRTSLENYKKPSGYRKFQFITSKIKFPLNTTDKCLDVGASAGGFSLYMLEQGVQSVLAVEISSHFEPFLEEIQQLFPNNFSYWIEDFFNLTSKSFSHLFNLVTADLTLDPYFLLEKLELFTSILQSSSTQARLLLTIKTGKIIDSQDLLGKIEQKINILCPNSSFEWIKSFPDKQEQFLLLLKS